MELEEPACPLCERKHHRRAYHWPRMPYTVVACLDCRFYFLSPRPTEAAMIARYRDDGYYDGEGDGYSNYQAQEQALRLTFANLLKEMAKRGLTGGSLLEVGCGLGYLLDEAKDHFEVRHGTDFSNAAAEVGGCAGAEVFVGGIDAAPNKGYDCIISNHVIEHVYRPEQFVKDLLARLRPGGALLISTPNMGSLWRRFMGARWPSFKLPEHILYFDRHHLHELLLRAGVSQLQTVPYPHAFPLALIGAKLGISFPERLGRRSMWMPQTTLAFCGRKPAD